MYVRYVLAFFTLGAAEVGREKSYPKKNKWCPSVAIPTNNIPEKVCMSARYRITTLF